LNEIKASILGIQTRSQELASLGIPGSDPSALSASSVVSAEKIMYQHAIDLCQSAALDELFGNPQLCPKVEYAPWCGLYEIQTVSEIPNRLYDAPHAIGFSKLLICSLILSPLYILSRSKMSKTDVLCPSTRARWKSVSGSWNVKASALPLTTAIEMC